VKHVREKNNHYVERGKGYDQWARRLGGPGCFIVLPTAVAEGRKGFISLAAAFTDFLRYYSRYYHTPVDQMVDHLKHLKIVEIANNLGVLPLGTYVAEKLQRSPIIKLSKPSQPAEELAMTQGRTSSSHNTASGLIMQPPPKRKATNELPLPLAKRVQGHPGHQTPGWHDSGQAPMTAASAITFDGAPTVDALPLQSMSVSCPPEELF
jgi:hypothetical protein